MSEILGGALSHARKGSPVFPCDPATKRPRTARGFYDATVDETTIRAWWSAQPDSAIGLRTGRESGIVVVDVDGPDGEESLFSWQKHNGRLPGTTEALTPHGRHFYFRHRGNGSTVRCAAPLEGYVGLDVRGDGGYVIAPPTPGYVFEVSSDGMADVPEALVDHGHVDEPETPPTPAEPILRGARNSRLASLGGSMRSRGMTEAAIRAALLEENTARCQPPLPVDEVAKVAASIGRYAPPEGPRVRHGEAPRDSYSSPTKGIGRETNPNGDRARVVLPFESAADTARAAPEEVRWVVEGILARGATTELSGKVKAAGKTTFALAIGRAAIDGQPFAGLRTTRTNVVYLTEQSGPSLDEALLRARLWGARGFDFLRWPKVASVPWEDVVAAALERCTVTEAGLLTVDTIGRWSGFEGDDENSSGAGMQALAPLQLAAAEGDIAVLVNRHAKKGPSPEVGEDGRGSSAISGAVDIVLSLRRPAGDAGSTARILYAISRFSATPETLAVPLTPEGYVGAGSVAEFNLAVAREAFLEAAPATEENALTVDELCKATGIARATG